MAKLFSAWSPQNPLKKKPWGGDALNSGKKKIRVEDADESGWNWRKLQELGQLQQARHCDFPILRLGRTKAVTVVSRDLNCCRNCCWICGVSECCCRIFEACKQDFFRKKNSKDETAATSRLRESSRSSHLHWPWSSRRLSCAVWASVPPSKTM
jgi:hypothetical protein